MAPVNYSVIICISVLVLMQNRIKELFPSKSIFCHLSDLYQEFSSQINSDDNICFSFETSSQCRKFCYFIVSELCFLFQQTIELERSLYEVIPSVKPVKLYIDFEYYLLSNHEIKDHLIGLKSLIKILHSVLNGNDILYASNEELINIALQQYLVLTASTAEKISYHIIHANSTVIFENNQTLGTFIRSTIIHFLELLMRHKCQFFSVDFPCKNYSLRELISLLTPHICSIRIRCVNCLIYGNWVYASDIAHLLVLNKEYEWTLSVDTHVYSKNQQFRVFGCVKFGQNNPFKQTNDFPFQMKHNHSSYDILYDSLITNIQTSNKAMVQMKQNNFILDTHTNLFHLIKLQSFILKLNETNDSLKPSLTTQKNLPSSISQPIQIKKSELSSSIDCFTDFVNNLIKHDLNHQGFIRSQLMGTRNPNVLIYNIGGNYRFCPRKGSHHLHNSICILIGMSNHKFAIRCKDPQCDNSILIWNKIQ